MRFWQQKFGLLGLWLALVATNAWTQDFDTAGVKFDRRIDVAGNSLVLNGAGVRYKAVFKVYAAGLYIPANLPSKPDTPEEVLALTGPQRIAITMLREVDSNELGKLFTKGVQDNVPRGDFAKLIPGLVRMGGVFSEHKKLLPGEVFTLDWVPGTGTVISIKGKAQGEPFKEPEFFRAMLSIWLGKSPADSLLKEALLGKPR